MGSEVKIRTVISLKKNSKEKLKAEEYRDLELIWSSFRETERSKTRNSLALAAN